MAGDNDRENGNKDEARRRHPSGAPPQHGSLEDLGERLRKARAQSSDPFARRGKPALADSRGLSTGLRVGIELVSGVAVGVGIGLLLDSWLGTAPWLLIAFLLIGCCAGFLTVYRTVQELERREKAERQRQKPATTGSAAQDERDGE